VARADRRLPDDDWIDPAVDGTQSARWREADIAVVANPLPGRLAGCTQLKLIQSLWAGVDRLLADATLPAGRADRAHGRSDDEPRDGRDGRVGGAVAAPARVRLRRAAAPDAVAAAAAEARRRGRRAGAGPRPDGPHDGAAAGGAGLSRRGWSARPQQVAGIARAPAGPRCRRRSARPTSSSTCCR
jgi:hypothetical protein